MVWFTVGLTLSGWLSKDVKKRNDDTGMYLLQARELLVMRFNLFLSCTLSWSQWIKNSIDKRRTDGTDAEYFKWVINLVLDDNAGSFVAEENKERPSRNQEICSITCVNMLTCKPREVMVHFLLNLGVNNEPLSLLAIFERCSMQGLHWHSIDCVSMRSCKLRTWHSGWKVKSMTHLQISS